MRGGVVSVEMESGVAVAELVSDLLAELTESDDPVVRLEAYDLESHQWG
ncbi:hypothetical protein N9962_00325 [bacterium]|nr:hypothetical protein [bacterium]